MAQDVIELQRYEPRPLPTGRDVAAVLFRQRWTMLVAFVVVALLLFAAGLWSRKYEAHMKILVLRQRADAMVSAQANAPAQITPDVTEEDLNSEVELLHSQDSLRKVVLATGLQKREVSIFGRGDEGKAIAAAVRKLDKDLDAAPIRKTNLISIKYHSTDPQLAANVLNAVASTYMEKHLEVHRPSGEFQFFDQQTAQFQRGLQNAQVQLADFTSRNGVVSAQLERDLTLQRLADFDANANQARASAAEVERRIMTLQTQLAATHPRITTAVKSSENQLLMQQLKSTLLNLEIKRTELLTKYDPSYRLVQEVDKQIADTKAAIATEESRPSRDETTDQDPTYAMLRSELAKAQEELSGLQARAVATGKVANEYRGAARKLELQGLQQDDLQRAEKTQEENYLLYQRKREEARIDDALDQRGIINVALAEQPFVPAIPAQSPVQTAGITLLLGFFVSLGAAFVTDYASSSFRTPDEVAGYLNVPVLASLPKPTSER